MFFTGIAKSDTASQMLFRHTGYLVHCSTFGFNCQPLFYVTAENKGQLAHFRYTVKTVHFAADNWRETNQ